jgi:hypothetical protein
LSGACSENFDSGEPNGGDAVVLFVFGFGVEVKEDTCPWWRTIERWGVWCGKRGGVDSVCKSMVKDLMRT